MDMEEWDALRSPCAACTGCGLASTRQNEVFGVGATDEKVTVILVQRKKST